jgi:hypothetical protein
MLPSSSIITIVWVQLINQLWNKKNKIVRFTAKSKILKKKPLKTNAQQERGVEKDLQPEDHPFTSTNGHVFFSSVAIF